MPTSEKFEPEIFLGTIHAVGSLHSPGFSSDLVHPDHVRHDCLISSSLLRPSTLQFAGDVLE